MKIDDLDPAQAAHILAKVKELQASDGWVFLQQIMAEEREAFFRKFSSPRSQLSDQDVHYSRGVVETSYLLGELPSKTIARLESHIQLKMAQQAILPTKP